MLLVLLLSAAGLCSYAQSRKLPDFSFKEHSIEFADANRSYNEFDQYTDTLKDEAIVAQLVKILQKNDALLIEVHGHTAINEKDELGLKRANFIREELIKGGVDSARLTAVNKAHSEPIISDVVLLGLPSKEEKEAANQKNRRVEIKVTGKREE